MTQTITRSSGLPATLTETYSYADPANRLLSVIETGGNATAPNQAYLYDAFGNRAVRAGSWILNDSVTNPTGIPTPQSDPSAATTFPTAQFSNNRWIGSSGRHAYDASGNLQSLSNGGSIFNYDAENRLATSNVGNHGLVTYAYDGEGHRARKMSGLGTTTYVYDAMGNLAAEYSTQPATASGTEYLTADHLGSTRLVTGAPPVTALRCYDYAPFGEEIPNGVNGRTGFYAAATYPGAADIQPDKFTGKQRDSETGLDYFGARYFSAAQGRFTSPDWSAKPQPIPYADLNDPQTLNLYAYVRNNPLAKPDIDGHAPDILVIEDGPTERNPIGHTAIGVTGQGVFSFGNNTTPGSSTTDYLASEAPRRDQTVTIIKTTPEQDKAAVDALLKQDSKGSITRVQDNCSSRSNAALDAAGIPHVDTSNPITPANGEAPNVPGTAGQRAQKTPGSKTIVIPKGSTTIPSQLQQFNPGPNQNPQLPKPENKKKNDTASS